MGSCMVLAAVCALIAPPTPRAGNSLSRPLGGCSNGRTQRSQNGAGMFEASAWEGLSSSNASTLSHNLDVDVQRLPTFVFFNHRGRRDHISGGADAKGLQASLEAMLDSFMTPLEDGDVSQDGVRDKRREYEARDRVEDDGIVDVASPDNLRRIVRARRAGQGPVVAMYHAPWCRKVSAFVRQWDRRGIMPHIVGSVPHRHP